MVKSPVEGSTAALVRLEVPVALSNFVRPVCLPDNMTALRVTTHCNALGWARHRKQLQRVQLRVSDMQRCENVSIATVNSLCTEAALPQQDCNVSLHPYMIEHSPVHLKCCRLNCFTVYIV